MIEMIGAFILGFGAGGMFALFLGRRQHQEVNELLKQVNDSIKKAEKLLAENRALREKTKAFIAAQKKPTHETGVDKPH